MMVSLCLCATQELLLLMLLGKLFWEKLTEQSRTMDSAFLPSFTHPLCCVLWFLQILVLLLQLVPKAEPAVELDIPMAGSNSIRSGSQ